MKLHPEPERQEDLAPQTKFEKFALWSLECSARQTVWSVANVAFWAVAAILMKIAAVNYGVLEGTTSRDFQPHHVPLLLLIASCAVLFSAYKARAILRLVDRQSNE